MGDEASPVVDEVDLQQTPLTAGNWYLPDPAKVYTADDIDRLTGLVDQAVTQAEVIGGDVLTRCRHAQQVWQDALASLTDPDRDKNGPKEF